MDYSIYFLLRKYNAMKQYNSENRALLSDNLFCVYQRHRLAKIPITDCSAWDIGYIQTAKLTDVPCSLSRNVWVLRLGRTSRIQFLVMTMTWLKWQNGSSNFRSLLRQGNIRDCSEHIIYSGNGLVITLTRNMLCNFACSFVVFLFFFSKSPFSKTFSATPATS